MITTIETIRGRNFTDCIFSFLDVVEIEDALEEMELAEFLFLFHENREEYKDEQLHAVALGFLPPENELN
ncbi:MAG: hypothetical protein OEY59_10865 [Deltaproteobacteria bacterium]|nr:hypothetical protein [Deltaproteobacteria bacterium]